MAQRFKFFFLVVLLLMFVGEIFAQDVAYTNNAELLIQHFVSSNKNFEYKSVEQKRFDSVYNKMISQISMVTCGWGKEFERMDNRSIKYYSLPNLINKAILSTPINFCSWYSNQIQKETL